MDRDDIYIKGERVTPIFYGLHKDEPAKIIGLDPNQYGERMRYQIQFEATGKRITLPANYLKRID